LILGCTFPINDILIYVGHTETPWKIPTLI